MTRRIYGPHKRSGRPAATDVLGRTFGGLTVLERAGSIGKSSAWLCRCAHCSGTKVVSLTSIRFPMQSCGCISVALRSAQIRRHGKTNSPEFMVWSAMLYRCINPNHPRFKDWGGRGISVCERWKSFANFYEDMGPRPPGKLPSGRALYTLERLNNDGNYEPGNCAWVTQKIQASNRRSAKCCSAQSQEI